jgi:hypothetical protein
MPIIPQEPMPVLPPKPAQVFGPIATNRRSNPLHQAVTPQLGLRQSHQMVAYLHREYELQRVLVLVYPHHESNFTSDVSKHRQEKASILRGAAFVIVQHQK